MGNNQQPTFGDGKICYIEIPAVDMHQSASFYNKVFNWKIRHRDNGEIAFDDAVGEVSGTWITGRKPVTEPGFMIHLMVDNITLTMDAIIANGGKITQQVGMDAPEITARFSDPAGNILGLYQQPA